jgi:hypothetical protein
MQPRPVGGAFAVYRASSPTGGRAYTKLQSSPNAQCAFAAGATAGGGVAAAGLADAWPPVR